MKVVWPCFPSSADAGHHESSQMGQPLAVPSAGHTQGHDWHFWFILLWAWKLAPGILGPIYCYFIS